MWRESATVLVWTRIAAWSSNGPIPRRRSPCFADLPGIEYLRQVRDGRLPAPPISQVFGMRFGEVEDGRIAVSCDPREAFFNPLGVVHGGLACTMLDTAVGCAVHTTLPQAPATRRSTCR